MKSTGYYADKAEDELKVGGNIDKAAVLAVLAELAMAAAWIEAAKLTRRTH